VVDRPVVHHHDGANAERVALAEVSRAKFTNKWKNELSKQPRRLDFGEDVRRVRDHRAARRIVRLFEGNVESDAVVSVAEDAAREAASNPRDRVTLIVPRGSTIGRLRRMHRGRGLEVVEVESVRHADVSWATDVRTVKP
jgi:hypothetical protein